MGMRRRLRLTFSPLKDILGYILQRQQHLTFGLSLYCNILQLLLISIFSCTEYDHTTISVCVSAVLKTNASMLKKKKKRFDLYSYSHEIT